MGSARTKRRHDTGGDAFEKRKKKLVLPIFLVLLLAVLHTAPALFRPVIRSAVSMERPEDGLYAMEYSGDYGLDEFLAGGRRFLRLGGGGLRD